MLRRAVSTLFLVIFGVLAYQTTDTLTSNGDTAHILGQTAGCALLLAAALYFRGDHESA